MASAVSIVPGEDGECATDDSQLPQAFVSSPPYYPWGHVQQQPWEPKGEQKYNNKKETFSHILTMHNVVCAEAPTAIFWSRYLSQI